jgi:hypothetical protein
LKLQSVGFEILADQNVGQEVVELESSSEPEERPEHNSDELERSMGEKWRDEGALFDSVQIFELRGTLDVARTLGMVHVSEGAYVWKAEHIAWAAHRMEAVDTFQAGDSV